MSTKGFGPRLGQAIKSRRESRGLSQEQLVRQAFPNVENIDSKKRALKELEAGRTLDPQPRTYRAICDLLEIEDHDFKGAPTQTVPGFREAPALALTPVISLPTGEEVIGREDDITWLHERLSSGAQVQLTNSGAILTGQGGIGKTTLARAYTQRHGATYDGVLWVEAETDLKIVEGLLKLCPRFGLARPPAPQRHDAEPILYHLQQCGERWLIIYDNVEKRDDLKDLIPQNAALIVTTRQGEGWAGFETRQTDVLGFETEDAPAVRLLMREAARTEDPAGARALAEALGGLPLALVIAGRMIGKEGLPFADYQSQVARIITTAPKNDDYPDSVIGAVQLSYDKLTEDAQLVADLFAWWAPEGLAPRLITDATQGRWEFNKQWMPESVQDLAQSPEPVLAAVEALEERSLLRRSGEDGTTFSLHRMSAAALRAMQGAAPLNGAAAALLAAVYPYDSDHSGEWDNCRRLTPHVRALMASGQMPEIAAIDYLLNQSSVFAQSVGDFTGAVDFARASLELKKARLPDTDRAIAVGFATLGQALRRAGDLDGAEEALRGAVDLHGRYRPDSELLAGAHNLLGGLLLDKGRSGDRETLRDALKERQKAAAIYRRTVSRQSDAYAEILNNLGGARDALGQGAAALRLYQASLVIWRAVLPEGDLRLAYGLVNVGSLALRNGQTAQAEEMLEEALALQRRHYIENPQHPSMRTTADWLISTYLTFARAGQNAGLRAMKARQLCEEFGFDYDREVETAKQFPPPTAPDQS